MGAKLVNLGSLCIDHVYRVRELVGAGETTASISHEVFPGGKGLNQSLAAARAGAEVHHVGCVGQDGGLLREILEASAVNVSAVRTLPDSPSGHAVIQVNDRGQNAIVIAGGSNRMLDASDLATARDLLLPGDWLLLQNEINDLPAALELTRKTGARLAFNVAPVDGREAEYDLTGIDLLIVNEIEARALVPGSVAAEDDVKVVAWLAENEPSTEVVLTAGAAGLVYSEKTATGLATRTLPAFSVAAIDETAAGDAFIGYLIAGLLSGKTMAEALRMGSAAGALAVTVAGAASSIPELSDVEALLRS